MYIPRDEDAVYLPFKDLLPKLQSVFQAKSTKDGFDSLDHVFDHQYNDQGDKLPVPQIIQGILSCYNSLPRSKIE